MLVGPTSEFFKGAAAVAALLLAIMPAQSFISYGYVVDWDPVGSLSGSWYDQRYEEFDETTGEYLSPWKLLWYNSSGQLEFESTTPRPSIYYPVAFSRAGTYRITMAGGAEAGSVSVRNGDLTLDLKDEMNSWLSLTLGTAQQAASLRLSGTGAISMNGAFLQNGLLALSQSAALEVSGLEVSGSGALEMSGSSTMMAQYDTSIGGVAVMRDNSSLSVGVNDFYGNGGLEVSGSLELQDFSRLVANVIGVSGRLQLGGDAELQIAMPEYATEAGVVVLGGGLLELNTSRALTMLGDLSILDPGSTLRVWKNHAAATSVDIYNGGRLELLAGTSLTVSGDLRVGRGPDYSWLGPDYAAGTIDLGSSGQLVAAGEQSFFTVQGAGGILTGAGMATGFTRIEFTGGGRYQPGTSAGPVLLSADEVVVGSATYSFDPVSAIEAPGVLGIGGHLRIKGGGLVELDATDALSAERITVASDTFATAVLRSRGGIVADAPDASADLTVGAGGLLEAELGVAGRVLLESTGRITAIGDLVMGDGQSADGFRMSGGTLTVGTNRVALLDYDGASIEGGTVLLNSGGKLESNFQDAVGGTSAIRLGGNAVLRGSGTIASRLLAYGSSMVDVSAFGALALDTSADIYEGTTGDFINFLHIGQSGEFRHNAGWDQSVVGMNWLSLESESVYRGFRINLQNGGGIIGSGRVLAEVRGAGVSIDTRGSLYLEQARLTDSAIRIGADVLTYRYGLSLERGSIVLQGGQIKPLDPFVADGPATLEFTQSTVSGAGLLRAEQPIVSRGSKFISSGGTLMIDSNLTGNGVLIGDVQVNGSITGQDTGLAISDLLVLSADAVVFGQGRTVFESGLDFGNGRRLSVQNGAEFAAGSVIRGSGTVAGSVINAGRIEPGNSPGSLTVEGSLSLASTSRIVMELGGTVPGIDYDRVSATGDLIYGGELVLTLAGSVRAGDSFQLFTSGGTMSGAFSSVTFEDAGYAGAFDAETGRLSVTAAPSAGDADGNGLPDDWEILHFGASGVAPAADADGDGTSNNFEYIAGTNPRDASSVFRSETWREGSQMILRIPTVAGRRYRLIGSDTMAPGSWTEIDAVNGDGSPLEWERSLTGGRYFLRVEVSIAGG